MTRMAASSPWRHLLLLDSKGFFSCVSRCYCCFQLFVLSPPPPPFPLRAPRRSTRSSATEWCSVPASTSAKEQFCCPVPTCRRRPKWETAGWWARWRPHLTPRGGTGAAGRTKNLPTQSDHVHVVDARFDFCLRFDRFFKVVWVHGAVRSEDRGAICVWILCPGGGSRHCPRCRLWCWCWCWCHAAACPSFDVGLDGRETFFLNVCGVGGIPFVLRVNLSCVAAPLLLPPSPSPSPSRVR